MTTTLDVLVASFNAPGNGCVSQGALFYGFDYVPTGNATAAAGVEASLIIQTGSVAVHGWNFSDSWSQAGSVLAGFTLSYSIEVCSPIACSGLGAPPGTVLQSADASYAPVSVFPPGTSVVSWSNGATVTLTSGSPGPLPANGNIGLGGGITGPITVKEVFSGAGAITQTSLRFYENAPVPEPGTLLLLGSGIAGLVLFARTKRG